MKITNILATFFSLFIFVSSAHAQEWREIKLGEVVNFKVGDRFKLQNYPFTIVVVKHPGTECAVPGRNCGIGYIPPHPTFKTDCQSQGRCPYVVFSEIKSATGGVLSIESQESCLKNRPENCFGEFARQMKSGEECLSLVAPLGQYYCLERFSRFKSDEIKNLCDKLPSDIYALRWNCFYNYAVRFNDEKFCEKYSQTAEDISGKNRCYLKMAQLLNDKKLCQKIVKTSSDSYLEQCLQ